MRSDQGHLTSLDGVRGVAALVVVAHHIRPAGHMWLAVDLFFILSGFVIAMSYEPKLRTTMSIADFAKVRLSRLYPMIFLGSLLGLATTLMGVGLVEYHPILLVGFVLWPLFGWPNAIYPLNGVFWSILFELLANSAHAIVAPVLDNRILVVVIVGALVATCGAALAYGTLLMGWEAPQALSLQFLGGFPRVAAGYFGGVFLYRTRERWSGFVPRLPFPAVALLTLCALLVPYAHGGYMSGGVYDELAVALISLPTIIALASVAKTTALTERAARFLGRISYPLYAIHAPIVVAAEAVKPQLWGEAHGKIYWLLVASVVLLASWIAAIAIDEPWQRYRKSRRRGAPSIKRVVA